VTYRQCSTILVASNENRAVLAIDSRVIQQRDEELGHEYCYRTEFLTLHVRVSLTSSAGEDAYRSSHSFTKALDVPAIPSWLA